MPQPTVYSRWFVKHRLPGTFARRLLWVQLVSLIIITLLLTVLAELRPACSARGEDCESKQQAQLMFRVRTLKAVLVVGPAALLCGIRYFEICVDRIAIRNPQSVFRRYACRDSWTMASSKDIFRECAGVLEGSHDGALLLACIATLAVSSLQTALQVENPANGARGWPGAVDMYLAQTCGPGWNPCRMAWVAIKPLMTLTGGAILYLQAAFLFIPRRAWSRVSLDAAVAVGDIRLQRLPIFFWSQLVFGPCVSVQGIFTNSRAITMKASRVELLGFTIFFVILLVVMLATIVWFNNLHRLLFPWRTGKRSARVVCVDEEANAVEELWGHQKQPSAADYVVLPQRSLLLSSREASKRYRQMVLLLLNIFMWCNDALEASRAYQSCAWLLRGAALIMLAYAHDAPTSFDDLSGGRAGFGLVVDAHQLATAIDAYLRGLPYSIDRISRYKASMLRMQETLAVSYRWQPETVYLSSDCCVNMSRWQLEQLLHELRICNCMYVWIDHLSVPQSDAHAVVQATLLARMMAVYASAGLTLALRSLELERNRYHQRGWTLQEYANASSLVVVTQEAITDEENDGSGLEAVRGEEEDLAKSLRRMIVAKAADRRPLWLYPNTESITNSLTEAEVREKDELYARLRGCQYTANPADVVRALYPLVYDRPAESAEELLQLVRSAALRMTSFGRASRASGDLALLTAEAETVAEASSKRGNNNATTMSSVRMRYIRTKDGEAE